MSDAVGNDAGQAGPERTCAGCRKQDAKTALLRLRFDPASQRLVPDVRFRLGGRGVSVHPRRKCVRTAALKGGFARALRTKIDVDPTALCEQASEQYARRAEGLLLSARRAGKLELGTDATVDALVKGKLAFLVVAKDAAGRRDELVARVGEPRVVELFEKVRLGRLFGRAELGVLAILDEGIGHEVATAAERATELSEAE